MLVYWPIYIIPLILALRDLDPERRRPGLGYGLVLLLLFFIAAFRETCGDWPTYLFLFDKISGLPLYDAISITESGYATLNWISAQLDFGIYGVNTVGALIFLFGLVKFSSKEPYQRLFLALSISYLFVVVAMGYNRQGIAIGIWMWGFHYLLEKKPFRYTLICLLAATFHQTAIVLLPLVYFSIVDFRKPWILNLAKILAVVVSVVFIARDITEGSRWLWEQYVVETRYSSLGALPRASLNAAAGLVFLVHWKRWGENWGDKFIWLPFAIGAILSIPLAIFASTAADRMGLYLLPFQILTFCRWVFLGLDDGKKKRIFWLLILGYTMNYGIWLHFGQFTEELWLPYRSLIFGEVD